MSGADRDLAHKLAGMAGVSALTDQLAKTIEERDRLRKLLAEAEVELRRCAIDLNAEALNYRDGEVVQPHGRSLRRRAAVATGVASKLEAELLNRAVPR